MQYSLINLKHIAQNECYNDLHFKLISQTGIIRRCKFINAYLGLYIFLDENQFNLMPLELCNLNQKNFKALIGEE